jgi:SDR family mycofactocin-dependent oxidoreductase
VAGRFTGKVAFITGAARGQGRAHAIRLAQEGADIIAVDICRQVASVPYALATEDDLRETAALVETAGSRVVASKADVRDFVELSAVFDAAVDQLGRIDIVSANAGIFSVGRAEELTEEAWRDMIDTNLTGVWHTAKVAIPRLRAQGEGGAIIFTSSANGVQPAPCFAHYIAAKAGVIGMMRGLALELASDSIRVNALLPGGVRTAMVRDFRGVQTLDAHYHGPDTEAPEWFDMLIAPEDVSSALAYLASDDARFVTGTALTVDGNELAAVAKGRTFAEVLAS